MGMDNQAEMEQEANERQARIEQRAAMTPEQKVEEEIWMAAYRTWKGRPMGACCLECGCKRTAHRSDAPHECMVCGTDKPGECKGYWGERPGADQIVLEPILAS